MCALLLPFVLVSLLSFSTAAPTSDDCSQMTQPAHELPQILGRWTLIEGFANNELFASILENMESMWMVVNTTARNDTLLLEQANRLIPHQHLTRRGDRCLRVAINATLTNDEDLEIFLEVARTYHRFLQTCADCLLMHTYNKENDYQSLYLFGRNETLSASVLETFRKQAECLQFPKPARFHHDTSKEMCPE